MRIVMFYHSLLSDWNHGNAHFLRGVATELIARGHEVSVFEPADSWSRINLIRHHGLEAIDDFLAAYPKLSSRTYNPEDPDLDRALEGADLVLVHEWNSHALVDRIGQHRARSGRYTLLFHDTHHRSVTDPAGMAAYRLESYDGVLAFGEPVQRIYEKLGWARRVWTWHEAADTRVFYPRENDRQAGHLVWIGNWGDDERDAELREFMLGPVQALGLKARVYGVRYPDHALDALAHARIEYGGWLPNHQVPQTFSRYRVTVHIPRRPYVRALPGIPTIRPFEALACGIPLVSAPWNDVEGLFRAGTDYLSAGDGAAMRRHLKDLINNQDLAREVSANGRRRVLERHTCAHRVDELMTIYRSITPAIRPALAVTA